MRVLAQESWSWTLFEDDASLVLSVLCGSVGLFSTCLLLSPAERAEYSRDGTPYLSRLAREVTQRPSAYSERHLAGFDGSPAAREAATAWRNEQAGSA